MSVRGLMLAIAIVAIGPVMEGCKQRQNDFVSPPPPEVSVAHPIVKTLPQTLEFTGFTRGSEQVDVRARVRGFIESRTVTGGERVKAGDVLFVIDPRPFQATVAQAQADVAQNEAKLRLAQIKLERTQQSGNAVSKTELDQATADRDAAKGALDSSSAKLQSAQLDLEYTNVRAPIDGRISVNVPNIGELVGENAGQALFTIINDATIYVTFNVPEAIVLAMRKQYDYSRPGEGGRPGLPVYVGFANDGDRYPFSGQYDSSEPGFDANTGTTIVKAIFKNSNGQIVPGAFARILSITGEEPTTLVPDAAVGVDQAGRYVMTVNDKGIVERTPVTVGGVIDQMRKLTSPLPADTQIIVNGLQRARPGLPVKPTLVPLREPKLNFGGADSTTMPSASATSMPTSMPTTMPSATAS